MLESLEAARRSYAIDDFERWPDAIYRAIEEFFSDLGHYPTQIRVHPSALERFAARADPEALRDAEGQAPGEDFDPESAALACFATERYEVPFVEDPALWPVVVALVLEAEGQPIPAEDTAPPTALGGHHTSLDTAVVVRPLHARVRFFSAQCGRCRHLVSLGSCAAFPAGIPLAIAQSRHDHRQPFPGDGGIRFEETVDQGVEVDATRAFLFGDDEARLTRSDGPEDQEPGGSSLFGSDEEEPELPEKEEIRRRAREAIKAVIGSADAEGLDDDELCTLLQRRYPVTVALVDRLERVAFGWQTYVKRYLKTLRRVAAKRR